MLTTQLRSQFVTKILISQTGEQFRVVFLVALVNGEMQAQVVSAECLSKKAPEAVMCLPKPLTKTISTFVYKTSLNSLVSPFTSLFFFDSQPTRAPAFI